MVLSYFGNGAFRLQSGDTSILVNPENNRLKADVTLKTIVAVENPLAQHHFHSVSESGESGAGRAAEAAGGTVGSAGAASAGGAAAAAQTIAFPGEYEIKEIEILGYPIAGESTEKFLKTAYAVYWEDMKFVFLGHLSKPMDASLMEEFSEADVLVLPVGGGHFLEPEIAAKIAKQLEARIVVPSFYKKPDEFLKALGKKAETEDKFVFKQKDIASDKGRPIVLRES